MRKFVCIPTSFSFSHVVPVPFMGRKIPKRSTKIPVDVVKTLPDYKSIAKSKIDFMEHRKNFLRTHQKALAQHSRPSPTFVASIPYASANVNNEIEIDEKMLDENRRIILDGDDENDEDLNEDEDKMSLRRLKILRKIVKKVVPPSASSESLSSSSALENTQKISRTRLK